MTNLGLVRSTSATSLLLLTSLTACVIQIDDGDTDTDDPATTSATTSGPGTSDDTTTAEPATTSADTGSSSDATATDDTATDDTATEDTGPMGVTLEQDVQPILDEHCVNACHSPGGEWSFLSMAPGEAYASLVGVMSTQAVALSIIEPGDPDASYLWHKINGTQAAAGGGGLDMPKAMGVMEPTVLTPEQFDTIEQWILQGAMP